MSEHETTPKLLPNGTPWTVAAEVNRERRGHDFYPSPTILAEIPPLYATEGTPTADKIVHAHYRVGACMHWFVIELDPKSGLAFGWAHITDGEWGYFHLPELEELVALGALVVERDQDWRPKPVRDVPQLSARY
ncbi:DUF2958 domain-containing protein [Streptomyces sp. NPDC002952]|uniref:DUF2958 domain-containing protein n=1 Tax=Streptomyces sp. NPDC002952 TaxID=3364673 RepID=UPI0036BD6197